MKCVKAHSHDEVHKMFDRNGEFRSSYDTLQYLYDDFPGVPVMALTATLNEEQLKLLCEKYIKKPVMIKSTVDRPNIKHTAPLRSLNNVNLWNLWKLWRKINHR